MRPPFLEFGHRPRHQSQIVSRSQVAAPMLNRSGGMPVSFRPTSSRSSQTPALAGATRRRRSISFLDRKETEYNGHRALCNTTRRKLDQRSTGKVPLRKIQTHFRSCGLSFCSSRRLFTRVSSWKSKPTWKLRGLLSKRPSRIRLVSSLSPVGANQLTCPARTQCITEKFYVRISRA